MFVHDFAKAFNLTLSECLQKIVEPLEICSNQTLKDVFIKLNAGSDSKYPPSYEVFTYQFSDVEDVFAEKDSHAHLNRPLLLFIRAQVTC